MPFPIAQLELLDPVSGRKPIAGVSEKFKEKQIARGKLSGLSRREHVRERNKTIVRMWAAGWSSAAVAGSIGVSARTVQRALRQS